MATIEGMVLYPSREGITNGLPSFTAAAAELVVPRSIPIIAPLMAAFAGGTGAGAGARAGAFGGGCVITGGGSFGSRGRVEGLAGIASGGGGGGTARETGGGGGGGGTARETGGGGGVIPFSVVMSGFGCGEGATVPVAAAAQAGSALKVGGG